jgi:hypothetical protein
MASKSKRARMTPARNLSKTFLYWAFAVFVVKLLIIFNIQGGYIEISEHPFFIDGVWLGADGENYIKGYEALSRDGLLSKEGILNYWPAGYPILIYCLSLIGKSWTLTLLSIVQSLIFSYSTYFFAVELSKTRIRKYAYLVILVILLNPTLSLSSLTVGYESITASGMLFCIGLVIRSFVLKNDEIFFKYLTISSVILGLISFVQPRLILAGLFINIAWVVVWKGVKGGALMIALSVAISLFFPATLIYRNDQAVGIKSVSTNLGVTMNIGAGNDATGGYMKDGFGVECNLSGTSARQDSQRVRCILNWYISNPTKSLQLFYNKSIYFWSPWINNGFAGDVFTGTMNRNPWLKISPLTSLAKNRDGANLIFGPIGRIVSWLWLLGGITLLFYGYLILWRQNSIERFIGNLTFFAIGINWLITLFTIGDHRFRIPIMGLSLFLQAVGLKTLLKGGKVPLTDGPSLR